MAQTEAAETHLTSLPALVSLAAAIIVPRVCTRHPHSNVFMARSKYFTGILRWWRMTHRQFWVSIKNAPEERVLFLCCGFQCFISIRMFCFWEVSRFVGIPSPSPSLSPVFLGCLAPLLLLSPPESWYALSAQASHTSQVCCQRSGTQTTPCLHDHDVHGATTQR